jgi:hypothetical protein
VGFFSARDATGRGAETWFAAEGAVLEALVGMPVTQYLGLSSEGRTVLLKVQYYLNTGRLDVYFGFCRMSLRLMTDYPYAAESHLST